MLKLFSINLIATKINKRKLSKFLEEHYGNPEGTIGSVWDPSSQMKLIRTNLQEGEDYSKDLIMLYCDKEEDKIGYDSFCFIHNPSTDLIRIKKNTEDILRDYYSEVCEICHNPMDENLQEFNIPKEPKSVIKFVFGIYPMTNVWLTSLEYYNLFFKEIGIEYAPVTIGKEKKLSSSIIRLIIPEASSDLDFGNSDFGNIINYVTGYGTTYSKDNPGCINCGKITYTNCVREEVFPNFKTKEIRPLVMTRERFVRGQKVVASRSFIESVVSKGKLKWSDDCFMPMHDPR